MSKWYHITNFMFLQNRFLCRKIRLDWTWNEIFHQNFLIFFFKGEVFDRIYDKQADAYDRCGQFDPSLPQGGPPEVGHQLHLIWFDIFTKKEKRNSIINHFNWYLKSTKVNTMNRYHTYVSKKFPKIMMMDKYN